MGDNVLALLHYLSSEGSPVPRLQSYSPPQTAYLTFGGRYFVMWSFKTGQRMYNALLLISGSLIYAFAPKTAGRRVNIAAAGTVLGGLIGAIMGANIVALLMTKALNKSMSWFAMEWYALVLYGLPALVGTNNSTYP